MNERKIEIKKTAEMLGVEESEVVKMLDKDITHSEMRLGYVCMGKIIPKGFVSTLDTKWEKGVKIIDC